MGKLILNNLVSIVFSALIVVLIVAGLFSSYGWPVIYTPLLLGGGGLAIYWGVRRVVTRKERQAQKIATLRRRTAELEAALGLPLTLDGACPFCGEPLLLGAQYCSACGKSLIAPPCPPAICDRCQTRNLDGARFCGVCGARIRSTARDPATPALPSTASSTSSGA